MTLTEIHAESEAHIAVIAELRQAHGFSEVEARDYLRFCEQQPSPAKGEGAV